MKLLNSDYFVTIPAILFAFYNVGEVRYKWTNRNGVKVIMRTEGFLFQKAFQAFLAMINGNEKYIS